MAFWIWIIAALLLLALEVAAPGFIMCSLAVGCIAAAAGAAFSLPLIWQVVLCALGMVLGFSVIRPLLQRKKDGRATNAERMIGMPAEVVEAIPAGGKGYVMADGVRWLATSGQAIQAGRKAIIKGIDGTTLAVEEEK